MEKNNIVLYHARCLDGFSGAWVAWRKLGDSAEYIPVSHQKPAPEGLDGKTLFFVDFIYPEKITEEIKSKANKIVAIDHHESTKDVVKNIPEHLFSNNNSGAVLAWKYFYPEKEIPRLLKYVEDMDLWNFNLPNTKEIIAYLESKDFSFDKWEELYDRFEKDETFNDVVAGGKNIIEYKESLISRIVENTYLVSFEGLNILAVNSPIFQSEIGNFLYEKHPPVGLVWREQGDEIKVSLRSNGKVDVSKLAAKFGGGGHKAAAAFRFSSHKDFPWKLINDDESR